MTETRWRHTITGDHMQGVRRRAACMRRLSEAPPRHWTHASSPVRAEGRHVHMHMQWPLVCEILVYGFGRTAGQMSFAAAVSRQTPFSLPSPTVVYNAGLMLGKLASGHSQCWREMRFKFTSGRSPVLRSGKLACVQVLAPLAVFPRTVRTMPGESEVAVTATPNHKKLELKAQIQESKHTTDRNRDTDTGV